MDVEPRTTLAIILGASEFPKSPSLGGGAAFLASATDFGEFLTAATGFGLPDENLLDLFDAPQSPDDIDASIAEFLVDRQMKLSAFATPARDLIFYYVGHGDFTPAEQKYFLAIRTTRHGSPGPSSIRMTDLAATLMQYAKNLRRYLILDCCFAGSAFQEFQGTGVAAATRRKTLGEFPERGTALLCASSSRDAAIAPSGIQQTMFSGALLSVLRSGIPGAGLRLSLDDVGACVVEIVKTTYAGLGVRPEVSSPDQREGRVADIPVFPNLSPDALAVEPDTDTTSPAPRAQTATADLDAIYVEGVEAYWSERWDTAIELLQQVVAERPDHPDARAKLEKAQIQKPLETHYTDALAAANNRDWARASSGYQAIVEVDPNYKDAGQRLVYSRQQHQLGELEAELRRLAQVGAWAAVIKVGERLREIDPQSADPDGLMTRALAEVAAAERSEQLARHYRDGLRFLDAGDWNQALESFLNVAKLDPSYRDLPSLQARARRELSPHLQELPRGDPSRSAEVQPAGALKLILKVPTEPADATDLVETVAFSADGREVAVGTSLTGNNQNKDSVVRVWSLATGQELRKLLHKDFGVSGSPDLEFSPDGRWLATGSRLGPTWQLWDAATGKELWTVKPWWSAKFLRVAFSPDSRLVAVCSWDKNEIKVWDVVSRMELKRLQHDSKERLRDLAFSTNGRALATAGFGVHIWNVADSKLLMTVETDYMPRTVAFSPDDRFIAIAEGWTVRICSATDGRETSKIDHENEVGTLAFSPSGRYLATGDSSGHAWVWRIGTGKPAVKVIHEAAIQADNEDPDVYQVAFSRQGHLLATCAYNAAYVWAFDEAIL